MLCSKLDCEQSAAHLIAIIEEPKATAPDGSAVSLGGRRETLRGYCAVHVFEEYRRIVELPGAKSGDLVVEAYELGRMRV